MMGIGEGQLLAPADYPVHPVILTRSFEILSTEVTQEQWMKVMGSDHNPSRFGGCGVNCPVSGITVFDALSFANRLSEQWGPAQCYELENCGEAPFGFGLECERAYFHGPDCLGYRLPSESEWEYAAGATADTCFYNGMPWGSVCDCAEAQNIAQIAWFCGNSTVDYEGCIVNPETGKCIGPSPVAQKQPNALGLHDTAGNVYEMTGSEFGPPDVGLVIDPGFDMVIDENIVLKGGAFSTCNTTCCSAYRRQLGLDTNSVKAGISGFRLVRTLGDDGR